MLGHEIIRMSGSRQLRGVAAGIAESFLSRNNDVNGYWALGKLLRLYLRERLDAIQLDLVSGTLVPDRRSYRGMGKRYAAMFQKQVAVQSIAPHRIQGATLTIQYDQQLVRLNSPRDTHRCICCVKIEVPNGRIYSIERSTTCARHSILRETRSTRRKAQPSPAPYGSPAAGSPSGEA